MRTFIECIPRIVTPVMTIYPHDITLIDFNYSEVWYHLDGSEYMQLLTSGRYRLDRPSPFFYTLPEPRQGQRIYENDGVELRERGENPGFFRVRLDEIGVWRIVRTADGYTEALYSNVEDLVYVSVKSWKDKK